MTMSFSLNRQPKSGLLVTLLVLPGLAQARPDRNAYLNRAIHSVPQLLSQVKHDPEVADRYERHFALTKPQLLEMFSHLHTATLDSDLSVTMYSVPEGGAIKSHQTVMKKGTRVFENPQGQVVLKELCGNPVVPGQEMTEGILPPEILDPNVVPMQAFAPDPATIVPAPTITGEEVALIEPDTTPDLIATTTTPDNPIVTTTTTPTPIVTPAPAPIAAAGSGGSFSPLWLLVPVGVLIGTTDHGGHGTPIAPVPEPASIAALSIGIVGLAKWKKRS